MTDRETRSNLADAELAALVGDGDQLALESVFELYGGAVKAIALRVLRDEALAEDVTQDVFLAFWRAPHRYDAMRGSLRTYLVTMAHRRAVDTVRSEVARSRREIRDPRAVEPTIDEEVWARSLSETVREALGSLSPDEREAITLAYMGGLSYAEVARRLGAPEGTVKSRIRVGMRKLAAALGEKLR
ncbi:MAG: RNA polymerase sigma factor SigK [Acidimicrobiia bacterium]|nr:MAG: RNA polymerase sigma factor SigK [Acidimicrobiia bacterium]